jgi:diguanylate cyclase (GGDEF)-like protein
MESGLMSTASMMPPARGLVLRCGLDGVVLESIRDDLGLLRNRNLPLALTAILDIGSHGKLEHFLKSATRTGAAVGWEMVVQRPDGLEVWFFAAGVRGGDVSVIAAPTAEELADFHHYFFGDRDPVPVRTMMATPSGESSLQRCLQLTALNSELLNVQRELARRNRELQVKNEQLRLMQRTITRQKKALLKANRQLADTATRDPLTGLRNRRAMTLPRGAAALATPAGAPNAVSLLMIDVDHFKRINDQFGHPMGDQVLLQLADIFNRVARHGDMVVRYGGEEFALILLDCDQSQAIGLADRVLRAVRTHPWPHGPVTVSIGIATADGRSSNLACLIQEADVALYHCKQHSRDCAAHFAHLGQQKPRLAA